MNPILYSKRGGFQLSGQGIQRTGGGWPLSKLTLREQGLTFKFVIGNKYDLEYSDIDHIEITRFGWVRFITKDQAKCFAFAGLGVGKIVSILQEKQVTVSKAELAKLGSARMSNNGLFVFIAAVLVLTVLLYLGSLHLGPFAHLKFRGQ